MSSEPDSSPDVLGGDELAAALGTSEDQIAHWCSLALLTGDRGRFSLDDLERARLILYAERRGITAEDIADACRSQGDVLGQFVELITGGAPRRGRPIEEVAELNGIEPQALRRLWVAAGLGDQDEAYNEDVESYRWLSVILAAGLPEEAVIQLVRVFADALGRVADAEARLFHYYVHEQLRAGGLEGEALTTAVSAVADPIMGLVEPALLYFHRKAFQRASREDLILHLTEASTPPGQAVGGMTATILFVDLAGFTPLTESMGDGAAAEVVERFSDLVRDVASRHAGRVIKQIGDEFMLSFTDPADAVLFGLDVDDAVSEEERFPAVSIGAHHGQLLYREGDYIGTTVNIAARVTGVAVRHQFLVTDALRSAVRLPAGVELICVGPATLKGISGEVELHEVRRGQLRTDRVSDPVCHMTLTPGPAVITMAWEGVQLSFCSTPCAERFAADPAQYQAAVAALHPS